MSGDCPAANDHRAFLNERFGWEEGDTILECGHFILDTNGEAVGVVVTEQRIIRGGVCVRVIRCPEKEDRPKEDFGPEPSCSLIPSAQAGT